MILHSLERSNHDTKMESQELGEDQEAILSAIESLSAQQQGDDILQSLVRSPYSRTCLPPLAPQLQWTRSVSQASCLAVGGCSPNLRECVILQRGI